MTKESLKQCGCSKWVWCHHDEAKEQARDFWDLGYSEGVSSITEMFYAVPVVDYEGSCVRADVPWRDCLGHGLAVVGLLTAANHLCGALERKYEETEGYRLRKEA